MEQGARPTRSGLFAIELLIAVGVFVFCAAVCTGLLLRSEVTSRESEVLSQAVNEARSLSECYKAAGGDAAGAAERCGGVFENGAALLAREDYVLTLRPKTGDLPCPTAELTAENRLGEALFSWTVSAWEGRS